MDAIIPSYQIIFLPERYNETLLTKTDLTMKKNEGLWKT